MSAGISASGRAELTAVLGESRRFVTPAGVASALDLESPVAAKKLARWAEQGWVRRVRRGLYIGVPVDAADPFRWSEDPLAVATEVWHPCYFSGWTAARHWGLTEQVFRTTVVRTPNRVRAAREQLLDHDYLVSHVPTEAMTWGLRSHWLSDVKVQVADPARCVVEMLDRPALGGGIRHVAEVLASYLDEHTPADLVQAGDRWGNMAVFKRLGYLAESLDLGDHDLVDACKARLSQGVALLDPDVPRAGHRVMQWGLLLNVAVVREGAS